MTGSDSRPSPPGVKLTYDDFVLFPDDRKRHELIDGEHYVTPSPNPRHQTTAANTLGLMWKYLRQHPIDVVFSDFDVVEPDLLYVSRARQNVLTEQNVQGAPDLVVEIGSPSTRRRDEKLKHQLYERFGVAEYWVVDPDLDAIRVYRLTDGRYERVHELSLEKSDVLTTPLLPGLELPLLLLFED